MNQEEKDNLNRLITTSETESVIKKKKKKPPCKQNPGLDSLTGESYQTCKKELISIHLKFLPKHKRGAILKVIL